MSDCETYNLILVTTDCQNKILVNKKRIFREIPKLKTDSDIIEIRYASHDLIIIMLEFMEFDYIRSRYDKIELTILSNHLNYAKLLNYILCDTHYVDNNLDSYIEKLEKVPKINKKFMKKCKVLKWHNDFDHIILACLLMLFLILNPLQLL